MVFIRIKGTKAVLFVSTGENMSIVARDDGRYDFIDSGVVRISGSAAPLESIDFDGTLPDSFELGDEYDEITGQFTSG